MYNLRGFPTLTLMDSLVSPQEIAAHLRFLGANRSYFNNTLAKHRLVHIVQGKPCPTIAGQLFFRRCVYRFTLWIVKVLRPKFQSQGSNQGLLDYELPPFDVALLLHAYMLHPRPFYEDTIRLYPELAVLKGFPMSQVVRGRPSVLKYFLDSRSTFNRQIVLTNL